MVDPEGGRGSSFLQEASRVTWEESSEKDSQRAMGMEETNEERG